MNEGTRFVTSATILMKIPSSSKLQKLWKAIPTSCTTGWALQSTEWPVTEAKMKWRWSTCYSWEVWRCWGKEQGEERWNRIYISCLLLLQKSLDSYLTPCHLLCSLRRIMALWQDTCFASRRCQLHSLASHIKESWVEGPGKDPEKPLTGKTNNNWLRWTNGLFYYRANSVYFT